MFIAGEKMKQAQETRACLAFLFFVLNSFLAEDFRYAVENTVTVSNG